MPGRDDAHRHLDQRPEGVEAGQVPDQRVHHLSVHLSHLKVQQERNCMKAACIRNLSQGTGCSLLLWKREVSE